MSTHVTGGLDRWGMAAPTDAIDRLRDWANERVSRRVSAMVLALAMLAGLLPLVSTLVDVAAPTAESPALSAADEANIAAQIEAAQLRFRPGAAGTFEVTNAGAGITAVVAATHLEVSVGAAATPITFRTTAFGRDASPLAFPLIDAPVATDLTVSIAKGPVVEWFQNVPSGLEQGWTIAQRPFGDGALVLDLEISGGVVALGSTNTLMVTTEDGSALRYGGLTAFDASGRELPTAFEISDGGARIAVDDTGAVYPVVIDPVLSAIGFLEGTGTAGQDLFGTATALDGRWMAVAAPGDVVGPGGSLSGGTVYVYYDASDAGDWELKHQLTGVGIPGNSAAPQTGLTLDLQTEPDGVTIVVGMETASGLGRIGIWTIPGDPDAVAPGQPVSGPTMHTAMTSLPNVQIGRFGRALDINGDLLVVAANATHTGRYAPDGPDLNDDPDPINERIGLVEVLRRSGGFGTPFVFEQTLHPPGGVQEADPDQRDILQDFGLTGVAVDGALVAIGAPGDDGVRTPTGGTLDDPAPAGTSTNHGAVHLYRHDAGTWAHVARVTEPAPQTNATFGRSVAIAGGDVLAGAPGPTSALGRAHLFDHTGGPGTDAWDHVAKVTADNPATPGGDGSRTNDRFGWAVDFDDSGHRMIVGAQALDTESAVSGGAVVFERATLDASGVPVHHEILVPETRALTPAVGTTSGGSHSGTAVALADGRAVVGSPRFTDGRNTWPGGALAYTDTGSGLGENRVTLEPIGDRFNARFGSTIARDGDVLAVLAPDEYRTTHPHAIGSSALYVFNRTGGAWTLEHVLYPTHGSNPSVLARFESVDIHVRRDANGDDIGLLIAVGIPANRIIDQDGRGDTFPAQTLAVDVGTVGVYGRRGGPGTNYDQFPTGLWAGGNDAWGQTGTYDPSTLTPEGRFGTSVAFADDGTLYVGAPGDNGGAGAVHRFEQGTGTWSPRLAFAGKTDGLDSDTGFGRAVAADGTDVVAVGRTANGTTRVSTFTDGGAGDDLSPVRTFTASVANDGTSAISIDTSDGRIALGSAAGEQVRIYRSPGFGGAYEREAEFVGAAGDRFGSSVSLSRGADVVSVAVGAPGSGAEAGRAEVFVARVRADGRGVWSQAADLTVDTAGQTTPTFGTDVSHWPADGGTLVGAPGWDDPAVEAGRIFTFDTSGITEPAGPKAFVDVAEIGTVPAGASYIPTAGLPPSLLTNGAKTDGSIAAAPLGGIDLSQPPEGTSVAASPLSGVPLSGVPLSGVPLSGVPLSGVPLSGVAGGWEALLVGTQFEGVPLHTVTLSDVYALPSVQALTLGQIDLGATPLSGVPLSGVALGALPLSGVPIGNSASPLDDWCSYIVEAGFEPDVLGLDCIHLDAASNDAVSIVSIALAGVPLSGVPLSGVPLSGVDIRSTPLSGVPLSGVDIAGSPLSGVPLSGVDISSTPLSGVPLSGVPLSGVPLSGVPLSGVPLSGVPLSGVPLSGVNIAGTPLSGVPLSGVPLSGVPLSGVPLSGVPLSGVPLSGVPLSGVLLGGIPLSGVPLSGVAIAGTPLSGVPLSGVPLSGVPLSGVPLSGVPLSGVPLSGVPLSGVLLAGTPLSGVPLSSFQDPVTGALRSARLAQIELVDIADLDLVVNCAKFDCNRSGFTLGDAARAGALHADAAFGLLHGALGGIRVGDIADAAAGFTIEDFRNALGGMTLADITDFDDLTLGELPQLYAFLTLGSIIDALSGIRLGDIADAIDGYTVIDILAALDAAHLTLADITDFDDVTLGELPQIQDLLTFGDLGDALRDLRFGDLVGIILDPAGGTYDEADLRAGLEAALGGAATLGDLIDLGNLTLGEIVDYGSTTIGDLFAALVGSDVLHNITLGDLLLALIARSQYPWEALDLSRVLTQEFDASDASVPVSVAFRADAPDNAARTVTVEVRPPFGSALVPGSVALSLPVPAEQLEPTIVDGAYVWTFRNVPANAPHTLTLAVEPTVEIGSFQVQATATILEDDESAVDRSDVTVVEVLEPNDTLAEASALPDDTIVLSHVSSPDDIDVFAFEVTEPGTRVSINLSNLDADLDAVLYSPKASSASIQEPSPRSIIPVQDESASAIPTFDETAPEPADDIDSPVDLGDLAINQASINRGTRNEQIDTGVLSRTGTYYVAVSGYNGATNRQPYALRLKRLAPVTGPPCPARSVPTATSTDTLPSSLPDGTDTVFLVNRTRMNALYGATDTDKVFDSLNDLVTFVNDPAQVGLGVHAAVLPVDADPQVTAAYGDWDAQPCLPETANGVVSEIVRMLDVYRDAGVDLNHIVVVGGDDVIPFARVPDRTAIANEGEYASTFSDAGNALYATFATESFWTDDAYGDLDPYGFGDRVLFVSDTAVGRLVESPSEVADQMDDFVVANGLLDVGTGLVTGYDFLIDGSEEVAANLEGTYASVDTTLISDTWTRQDLEDAIASIKPDLASINAHFDHFRALPAEGNATGDESDLFTAAAVRGALGGDLAGSVVFSMGCHGGLTASDLLLSDHRALDFAQAISAQGGVFVGNTGYGYGDTEIVGLSEQLMADFAKYLDGSMSVGEALLYAKAEYAGDLTAYGVYDEKSMMEATLYGLPFYRLAVDDPPPPPALPDALAVHPDPVSGVDTSTVVVTPTHKEQTTADGETYFVAEDAETGDDLVTAVHDRPVQPRSEVAFTAPEGTEAHDALVVGITSTDLHGVNPYLFQPIVDSSNERTGAAANVVFPSSPVRVNPQLTPAGETFNLTATTGHFRTTATDGSGIQRLYDEMVISPYFADDSSTDFTRPSFDLVDAQIVDGVLSLTTRVDDDQSGADGVRRVYALVVEDPSPGVPTTWHGFDLVRTPGTDRWSGSMAVDGEKVELLVQAVDASGNVAVTTNKALNFRDASLPLDPPSVDLDVTVSGTEGLAGWYTSNAVVSASGGSALTIEVLGSMPETAYTGPLTLADDGLHTVIVRSSDGQRITTTVRVDKSGPTAAALVPSDGAALRHGSGVGAVFTCPDAGSGTESCTATLNGQPITNGDDVTLEPGAHTLVVTASPDRAGNSPTTPTATVDFVVVPNVAVDDITVLNSGPGIPTEVEATFTGDPVGTPYSVTFAWDDGTTTTCATDATSPDCDISIGEDGRGTARASHSYSGPGTTRTITATVTDRLGGSDARSVTINLTTAISATPILLKIKLFGGITVTTGGISATLTDDNGSPMVGRRITFSSPSGSVLCTATTDTNGRAGCSNLVLTLSAVLAGSYKASFAGDLFHLPVSTTAPILIIT